MPCTASFGWRRVRSIPVHRARTHGVEPVVLAAIFCALFGTGCYRGHAPERASDVTDRRGPVISSGISRKARFDPDLSRIVRRRLERTPGVAGESIRAIARDGIVELSGLAQNLYARQRAGEVVARVHGVRAVVNRIDVLGGGESDEEIEEQIRRVLLSDPKTGDLDLAVAVFRGRVRLTGDVKSLSELRAFSDAASAVRGVREVDTRHITIDPTNRTDGEIRDDVLYELQRDGALDTRTVHVEARDGVVLLKGKVRSLSHVTHARLLAHAAAARPVVANLEVDETVSGEDIRIATPWKTDAEVQRTVREALRNDPRLEGSDIGVQVQSGIVTLSGLASNAIARRAALGDAQSALGARRVVDELRVQPMPTVPDDILDRRVERALAASAMVDANRLAVSVYDGKVFLNGIVEDYSERVGAERISQTVPGVVEVENALIVGDSDSSVMKDRKLLAEIERRLLWEVAVDPGYVLVEAKQGIVTLTGLVTNWEQFGAVLEDVYDVVRPTNVVNRLEVEQRDGSEVPEFLETWTVPDTAPENQ